MCPHDRGEPTEQRCPKCTRKMDLVSEKDDVAFFGSQLESPKRTLVYNCPACGASLLRSASSRDPDEGE